MSGSNSAERKRHEPLVLVETADLSEEDWLDYRRRGIGGSDSHKIGHFHWYMILVCWNGSSGSMQSRQRNTAGKPTWCCAR